MVPNFDATCVTVDATENSISVGFADSEFDAGRYLMLQRADNFSEEDTLTGMNDIYIERDDQQWSRYGGMRRCELLTDRFRVEFEESAAATMGGLQFTEVSFDIAPRHFTALRNGLLRCFQGFEYFVDSAGY